MLLRKDYGTSDSDGTVSMRLSQNIDTFQTQKMVLLLKNPDDLIQATALFEGTGVQFETDGHSSAVSW